MNILNNKELLRGLLRQSDILNTIYGGSALTSFDIFNTEDSIVIKIGAPTVPAESFNIVLNEKDLVVFSVLTLGTEDKSAEDLMAVPSFMKTFVVPENVDTDKIEAIHEDDQLTIIMPYHQSFKNKLRQIKIKQI